MACLRRWCVLVSLILRPLLECFTKSSRRCSEPGLPPREWAGRGSALGGPVVGVLREEWGGVCEPGPASGGGGGGGLGWGGAGGRGGPAPLAVPYPGRGRGWGAGGGIK